MADETANPSVPGANAAPVTPITDAVKQMGVDQYLHLAMKSAGLIDDAGMKWLSDKQIDLVTEHLIKQKAAAPDAVIDDVARGAARAEAEAMAKGGQGMPKGFQLGVIATKEIYKDGKPLVSLEQSNALLEAQAASRMAVLAETGIGATIDAAKANSKSFSDQFAASYLIDSMMGAAEGLNQRLPDLGAYLKPETAEALKGLKDKLQADLLPARQDVDQPRLDLLAARDRLVNAKPWIAAEADPVLKGMQASEALVQEFKELLSLGVTIEPQLAQVPPVQQALKALGNLATLNTYIAANRLEEAGIGALGQQLQDNVGWRLQSPPHGYSPDASVSEQLAQLQQATLGLLQVSAPYLAQAGVPEQDLQKIAQSVQSFGQMGAALDQAAHRQPKEPPVQAPAPAPAAEAPAEEAAKGPRQMLVNFLREIQHRLHLDRDESKGNHLGH